MPCYFVDWPFQGPGNTTNPDDKYPLAGGATAVSRSPTMQSATRLLPRATSAYQGRLPRSGYAAPAFAGQALPPPEEAPPEPRQLVALTSYPRRVTAADSDELRNALDVSDFDELDLLLHVLAFESGTADLTVAVDTAMQHESDDAWVTVATFSAVTSAPSYELVNATGILRYVRFRVDSIDTAPAIFTLMGMGRRRGHG